MKTLLGSLACLALILGAGSAQAQDTGMSFFVTSASPGDGANLGGLEGADMQCQTLADAAGAGVKTWRAYLSTSAVNARDRIGDGPWHNAKGELIANTVDELHSDANKITKQTALTEKGDVINGRGDTPNQHDILTGSNGRSRHDLRGLDQQCQHRQGIRRPSRPDRAQGRRAVEVVERLAPVPRLRRGRSAEVRRRWIFLLLRGGLAH